MGSAQLPRVNFRHKQLYSKQCPKPQCALKILQSFIEDLWVVKVYLVSIVELCHRCWFRKIIFKSTEMVRVSYGIGDDLLQRTFRGGSLVFLRLSKLRYRISLARKTPISTFKDSRIRNLKTRLNCYQRVERYWSFH